VGILGANGTAPFCGGSLISPNYVLTAGTTLNSLIQNSLHTLNLLKMAFNIVFPFFKVALLFIKYGC